MSTTHFGFQSVEESDKARHVRGVFDSVASKYDLMNDLMSGGLHRAWKAYTVAVANVREGDQVLDIAGGTGDLALAFSRKVGASGRVVHTDINAAMLGTGRNRLLDAGVVLPTVVCDAEKLPFESGQFDLVSVAFGLRNMTHKDQAIAEMCRVLKPGGKLLVLIPDLASFGQAGCGGRRQLPLPGRVDPHAPFTGRVKRPHEKKWLWACGLSQHDRRRSGLACWNQVLRSQLPIVRRR